MGGYRSATRDVRRLRGGGLLGTAVLAGLVVVFGALMSFQVLAPGVGQPVSYLVQCATVLAACVAMGRRAVTEGGELCRARGLLSASLLCAALGGVLALVVRLAAEGAPPVPSVADAVHFLFLPLCVAGLLSYPVLDDTAGSRRQMLLDGAVAASALWFVTYAVVLAPSGVGAGLPLLTAVTILAYPASDVFVIAMAAGALRRVDHRAWRELAISALGVSLYGLSDIAYTVLSARGAYEPDSWVAALAEAGLVLVLVAALTAGRHPGPRPPWVVWLGGVPYVCVAVAITFAAGLAIRRDGLGEVEVVLLVLVIAGLLGRQVRANRDRDDAITHLRDSRVLFRALAVGSSDLITLHSADGRLRYASPAVSRLTGIDPDSVVAGAVADLVHPDDLTDLRLAAVRLRRDPAVPVELVVRVRAADGSWRWCQTVARSCLEDPSVQGIVCNTRDIHERHLLEQQIRHDAHHDALTGLGNLAQARLMLAGAHADRDRIGRVVGLLDLDGFKEINDTYGHAEGDRVLRAVASLLSRCLREGDQVARIGGDEFLLVLLDDGRAEQVALDVLAGLQRPLGGHGRLPSVGASIGLAPVRGEATRDEVLQNADLAMYAAKAAGRNRLAWFDPGMRAAAQHHGGGEDSALLPI